MKLFRASVPGSTGWIVFKTLAQTILFWAFFLWLLPMAIVMSERRIGIAVFAFERQEMVGWIIFAGAGLLGLTSASYMAAAGRGTPLPMDCASRLVVRGPYAHVRNPMAIAGLAQGAAVGLMLGSWSVLIYVLVGGLVWNFTARPLEEHDMAQRFGTEFEAYRRNVRCWIPRVRAWKHKE